MRYRAVFVLLVRNMIHVYVYKCITAPLAIYTVIMMTSSNGTFYVLLAICVGSSPVNGESPHKGQWRGALMFSLIYAWINGWVNNRDLRRHPAHSDVTVMYDETRVYHCKTVALSAPLAWSIVTTHVTPSNYSCQKPQTVIPIGLAPVEFSLFFSQRRYPSNVYCICLHGKAYIYINGDNYVYCICLHGKAYIYINGNNYGITLTD